MCGELKEMEHITWKTQTVKISDLIPFDRNPRHFTEKGMKDLANSMDKFGLAQNIVINTDMTVIGGHARLVHLKKQGAAECQCNVPNRKLTDKEVEELCIRLNANTAGEWDWEGLANWNVDDLEDWGLDIPGIEANEKTGEEFIS